MPTGWPRFDERVRFGLTEQNQVRPQGVISGRWFSWGPFWIRLGRRSSWPGEDEDAEMIKPVKP